MGRPLKENSLTPQDLIRAAIDCLDKEGESALGVNRVAKELGIKPPAIYKHLDGNTGLRRAVALEIWRNYLTDYQERTTNIAEPRTLLRIGAQATRNFAQRYPARYLVMMQYQLRPTDPAEAKIIYDALYSFKKSLQLYELSDDALIDTMRMVNAAIYGFIVRERSELMTLNRPPLGGALARSADRSYEVMLDALLVAIKHIQQSQN